MAICYENALKNNISSGNILNNYFIFGEDTFLKKQYVDKIIDKIVDREDVFNYSFFESECDLQEVYDAKEQFPMLSDKKCVVLCDFDIEKCSKSDFEKIKEMCEIATDTTVFILWCNNLQVDIKKNDRVKKIIEATEKSGGMAAQIDHRSVEDLKKMLIKGAQKRGCEFQSGVAEYMVDVCGNDINLLVGELEKVCAYVGKGKIERDIIDNIITKTVEASIFDLSKQIFDTNIPAAVKLIDKLFFLRIESNIILHNISSSFVDAYRVFCALKEGVTPEQLAKEFGYGNRAFLLRRLVSTVRNIGPNKFHMCFDEILAADRAIKSFSASERVIIEQLIIKLVYILTKGEKIVKD